MGKPIPTYSDFAPHANLDAQDAAENLLDKDLLEAEQLFERNFLYYQEDLMWMDPIAFSYYVQAAVNYLLGPNSVGDSDAASTFPGAVMFQYDTNALNHPDNTGYLIDALSTVADRIDRYDCDVEIYGDVAAKYRRAVQHLRPFV